MGSAAETMSRSAPTGRPETPDLPGLGSFEFNDLYIVEIYA
jgi:hypothetical protein